MNEIENEHFIVEGMSCASCVSHVEKAVKSVNGVKNVNVNLLTNSMDVSFVSPANIEKIEKSVAKAGYKATSIESKSAKKNVSKDKYGNNDEAKRLLFRLIPSFIILIPLFYIGMGAMLSWPLGALGENLLNLALTELVLSSLIIVINLHYYISGFKALFHLSPNMDSLVALGSGVSFVYSLVILFLMNASAIDGSMEHVMHLSMNLSFESAGMVPTFVLLGKTLEAYSKGKTTSAISSLLNLAPKEATVIKDGEEIKVLAEEIRKNDVILVHPGEGFPVDGVVIDGFASVDESSLTGESLPVYKEKGSKVYSGTANIDGLLKVEAKEIGEETTLNKIVKLVEQTASSKPKIAKIADKAASFFVPTIILVALIVFICWMIFGANFVSSLDHYDGTLSYALERALSVLVISCPCALGLATPVAVMVASGKGAKNGLLYKNAEALEEASKCHYVVFDKTGTLTKGKMSVVSIVPSNGFSEKELLEVAYSLEKGSEHPLAKAIVDKGKESGIEGLEISCFKSITGKGVEGKNEETILRAGNRSFIEEITIIDKNCISISEEMAKEGKTPLFFSKGRNFCGLIAISDELKDDAKETISILKEEGYTPVMLTGDNEKTAARIAKEVGIEDFRYELLPGDKVNAIKELKRNGKVMMVGDGINDAPALSEADVGIAIGSGTDIAIDSASLVLTKHELKDVIKAIHLSRLTIWNIKENLFWAFFYNLIMIPIAAGAFSGLGLFSLKPWMGAAAMSLSSVTVVLNALRLNLLSLDKKHKRRRRRKRKEAKEMSKVTMHIEGMMCPMCVKHVKEALESLGYQNVLVDLDKKEASFETDGFEAENAKKKIEDAGYKVTEII